ncbi:hypothetical protein KY343_05700 [Candidatus Woesearchaeota archaeon]|nr:hypothetical protein [Candidatus Woesearchaeota archaeon]
MAKTKKVRRHSGRKTISSSCEGCPDITLYDEWLNYRDSARGYNDKTKLNNKGGYHFEYWSWDRWNKKIKRDLKIRKAKKLGRSILA